MQALKEQNKLQNYEQLLTDIQGLPNCLSQIEVEKVFDKIKGNEFLSQIDYFETLRETKESGAQPTEKRDLCSEQDPLKEWRM